MHLRRVAAAGVSALVAAALTTLPASGPAYAEEVYSRPANGVFVMDGHGWGHGRGLNQWGAQGAALSGVGHLQILAAYYPGTTHTTIAEASIRVQIQDDEGVDTQVRSAEGLTFTDVATGEKYAAATSYSRWRAYHLDANGFRVQALSGSTWVTFKAPNGKTQWRGPIRFSAPHYVRLHLNDGSARDFRGTVNAVRTSGNQIATVNVLSLEHYLYGVVPRESPASFHPEALRAQAVAARSYSAYKRAHASGQLWDICSTTQCQVYGGFRHVSASGTVTSREAASTNDAISATARQVRAYQGAPIFAEFSSSNGGWSTRHSTFPYLAAKRDDWDKIKSPHHAWVGQVSVAQIEARYPSLGRLRRLRVVERDGNGDWGGRVKRVILEGNRSDGTPTSVESTGGGIYFANPWTGGSDTGLRGSWWRIRSDLTSTVTAQPSTTTLVRPPGVAVVDQVVDLRNTGTIAWSTSGLHLAVASPAGSADPLSGGSTRPGTFVSNLDRAGATTVDPGERARFRLRLDLSSKPVGTYTAAYQARLGSGTIFGAVARWSVRVVDPVYTAAFVSAAPPADTLVKPGYPSPVSGRTVVLPRSGTQTVHLGFRNTGNVAWPVGAQVRLITSDPRARVSQSAGSEWVPAHRPSALVGSQSAPDATSVKPGEVGIFPITLHGNGRPAGTTFEAFEVVWETRAWMGGLVALNVVRTDPAVARLAVAAPLAPEHTVYNHPDGLSVVRLTMRNLGNEPWPVDPGEALATAPAGRDSRFATAAWTSPEKGGALVANRSRPGTTAVYPGELGMWELRLGALRVPAGAYSESFQAVRADGLRFGPVVTTSVRVVSATFSASAVATPLAWTMPRDGRQTVSLDVRNTGNVSWPVAGAVRSAALSGNGSAYEWISRTRPSAVTQNVSTPGATRVSPGQLARFTFVMAANNRAPGTYTEYFDAVWEAYALGKLRMPITFTISA